MHIQGYASESMRYMIYYFIYEACDSCRPWILGANHSQACFIKRTEMTHAHARTHTTTLLVTTERGAGRGEAHQPPQPRHEQKRSTAHCTGSQQTSQGTVSVWIRAWRRAAGPEGRAFCTSVDSWEVCLRGGGGRGRGRAGGPNITHWMPLWDVIDPFLLLTGGNLHDRPAKSVTVGSLKRMKQSSQMTDTVKDVNTKPWNLL